MSEEICWYRLKEIAKDLDGKVYQVVVTNGRTESKQIVIEYDHKKC